LQERRNPGQLLIDDTDKIKYFPISFINQEQIPLQNGLNYRAYTLLCVLAKACPLEHGIASDNDDIPYKTN